MHLLRLSLPSPPRSPCLFPALRHPALIVAPLSDPSLFLSFSRHHPALCGIITAVVPIAAMLAVVFLDSFDDSGLIKAFPSLPDDDLPTQPMDMHMTPDGSKWWIAGLEGQIVEVS